MYEEIVSIRLGIKQTSGNAVITFYDEDTNQFASTGHSAHFFERQKLCFINARMSGGYFAKV